MAAQEPIRILALSDLHLEFAHLEPTPDVMPDLVLLAGDIGRATDAITWAEYYFSKVPVVFVIGNHEAYRDSLELVLDNCRASAAKTRNIRFLENDQIVIPLRGRDVRVLGTCLWTDFKLNGDDRQLESMLISVPFLGAQNQVVLILFAECNEFNFFADDSRVGHVVAMGRGFCRLFDSLQKEPFENLRNFPLLEGKPVSGVGGVFSVQEALTSIAPPRFAEVPSFNYEASAA